MTGRLRSLALTALVLGLVGCDHVTKGLAQHHLRGGRAVSVVEGVFELRYLENRGVAFSLERVVPILSVRALVAGVGIALLVGLAIAWRRERRTGAMVHVGYAMILAGAIGNLADRLLRGYVIDFAHLSHWPVFNVADVLLPVGVGLIVLAKRPAPTTAAS